jgi:hypothetical protein
MLSADGFVAIALRMRSRIRSSKIVVGFGTDSIALCLRVSRDAGKWGDKGLDCTAGVEEDEDDDDEYVNDVDEVVEGAGVLIPAHVFS